MLLLLWGMLGRLFQRQPRSGPARARFVGRCRVKGIRGRRAPPTQRSNGMSRLRTFQCPILGIPVRRRVRLRRRCGYTGQRVGEASHPGPEFKQGWQASAAGDAVAPQAPVQQPPPAEEAGVEGTPAAPAAGQLPAAGVGTQPAGAAASSAAPGPLPPPPPPPPPAAGDPRGSHQGAPQSGIPPRVFVADVQPSRKRTACCRQCRQSFGEGQTRLIPKQKASTGGGWFLHTACVKGGLQEADTVVGMEELGAGDQDELQALGVQSPIRGRSGSGGTDAHGGGARL